MRHMYAKITFRFFLVSFLALILIGCGEKGNPGGDSGPGVTATIRLFSDDASLPADGITSTTIRAFVTDSTGFPVNERTSVVFHTSLGTFRNGDTAYEVSTIDNSGFVEVQLISDTIPGTAEVWAESNNVKQKIEVKLYDPHKVGSITLRTGSTSITADGTSQVSIIATVRDALGNVEGGATVSFQTTLGQFIVANPLPGITYQHATAKTDVDGEARVMLVSGKIIGTATILASVYGLNATTTVVFTAGEPTTISLRAAPSTIKPNGTSNLIAKLLDVNGNPVQGQSVVFSEQVDVSNGSLSPTSNLTDVNGEAKATYIAGKDEGENTIQAALSSDLGLKTTTTIVVDAGAIVVGNITLTAGSASLVADGIGKVKIRATVTDIDGNEAIGKTVTFTATAGALTPSSSKTSDIGIAESMLQSTTIAGPVIVRAECDGFIDEVTVQFVPGPADHIIMYAFPNVVPPNGAFQTAAIIQDKYDNRIDDERLILHMREAGSSEIIDTAEMTPDQAQDGVYRFNWTAAYGSNDLEITASVNNGVSQKVTVDVDESAVLVGSISVIAGATSIEADGKSKVAIRATVLDSSGQPAQGITVDFSTTLGTLSDVQVKTDQNGFAQVMLTSGTIWGTATLTAEANGFIGNVDVLFTTGKASGLHITTMPRTLKPGEKATVIAELHDSKGDPVANQLLYFDIYKNNTNSSLSAIQAVTDTNGRATVTYTAGVYLGNICFASICSGQDCIRVTLASNSSINATTCITVAVPTGSVGYLTLTSDKNTLPADGVSSTAVTAKAYDTAGIPMPEGTTITFTTTSGTFPGGVDPDGAGPITSMVVLTTIDDSGTIITSLIAGTTGGVAQITAAVAGLTQTLNIIIDDGTVVIGSIVLSANPTSIPADGVSSSSITAVVTDILGNPVPTGTPLVFTTTLGKFSNGFTSIVIFTPDASGTVTTSLIAGTVDGIAFVTATAGSLSQAIEVPILETITGGLALKANPDSIVADGISTSLIRATLTDTNGNPISGVSVDFATTLGTVDGAATATAVTNASGVADVTLKSGTNPGTAVVTAMANGITATVNVTFTSGAPGTLTLTAAPTTVNPGGGACTSSSCYSLSTLTATLVDGNGNPISDATIAFVFDTNASGATLSGPSATTDINGQATVTYTAGTVEGDDEIHAVSMSDTTVVSNTVTITVDADAVVIGSIDLTADPEEIPADGTSSSAILATLKDTGGNPMPMGTEVTFSTTLGTFPGGTDPDGGGPITSEVTLTITNSAGMILTSLVSATTPGSATVTASYDGVSQSVIVDMTGGGLVVSQIEVIIENTTLDADGVSTTNVYAYAKTALNQAVPDVSITFETTAGTITTPHDTDANGMATAVLTSARENIDPVTVTARYNLVSGTATLKFIGVTLTLSADPTSQVLGLDSTITATLNDAASQPIAGATVDFTTDNPGAVVSPLSAVTNASGVVVVQLQNSTVTGDITVTGTSRGAAGTVIVNYGDYQLQFLPPSPSIIQVGGGSSGTSIIAIRLIQYGTITCLTGNVSGLPVNFSSTLGTITPLTVYSFTVSPANATAGATYTDGGNTFTVLQTITNGTVLSATGTGVPGPSPLTRTSPPGTGDAAISYTAVMLTSGQTGACTQDSGFIYADAYAQLVSGAQGGTATVDAYVNVGGPPAVSYTATTSVSIISTTANKIILEPSPDVIDINSGVSTISARVLDSNDNPVANQILYFQILQGPGGSEYLSPSFAISDADGRCSVSFHAGSIPSDNIGDIIIQAADNLAFTIPPANALGSCNLTIAGAVHHVSVGVNLQDLPTPSLQQGHLEVGVSGIAVDINGNPVADGTQVYFSVKSIAFDEDRADDGTIDCWSAPGQLPINAIVCPAPNPANPALGVTLFTDDVNQDGYMYSQSTLLNQYPMAGTEDKNSNGILDPGEDYNGNGVLDPPQGNEIDSPKATTNGVATTTLRYPMEYADNVRVRITASAGGKTNFYDYYLLCTIKMVTQGTCGLGY